MLYKGMKAKIEILRRNPDMGAFIIKAYYEKDPEVHDDIQASYLKYYRMKAELSLKNVSKDQFRLGINVGDIFRHIFWEANGYLIDILRNSNLDVIRLEKDFTKMIRFWEIIYSRDRKE